MTPEEVESRVIAPVEQEMLGIPHQTVLRSAAKYAIADITINFDDTTDVYWARNQVNERLTGVMGNLPSTVSGGMAPISTPLSDMYMFTLEGRRALPRSGVLDWVIRPPCARCRCCRCQRSAAWSKPLKWRPMPMRWLLPD
jgi:cobalt-zinc-cadmium resistance protein CzcA